MLARPRVPTSDLGDVAGTPEGRARSARGSIDAATARRDAARSLDVDCVPDESAGVDELGPVRDRADGEPSLVTRPSWTCSTHAADAEREVAVR